ncbi:MAG: deoxyribose-phosphate aldolase [Xanthomonadaceae bacterium]|nr:deoxyribose-phosphate aldolase [Xanthomonadaceae bacterium]
MSNTTLASRLLHLLDLTSLGEDDTPGHIRDVCASARTAHGLPAAVCVYPEHVTTARAALAGTPVRIATVVNFPEGGDDPQRVHRETRRAIAAGADEIDMVLAWRALKAGDAARARKGVDVCRLACGEGITLKLILETGELASPDLIRQACELGLDAGVDFLKTSTGKVPVNATLAAAAVMLDAIAERGGRCGIKVAGGIRTLAEAGEYLSLVEAHLGLNWATPARFRIGASALFDAICSELTQQP